MAVILKIRNPIDLTTSYNQIEIQRSTTNTVAGMADISTSTVIDTSTASDLSSGYTSYTDANGTVGTHYYRFRYKQTTGTTYSSYSDIFLAGGSVLQSRFRRIMRDTNSSNYFFTADDLDFFEQQAVSRLWPITWIETYTDTFFTPDSSTEIFNFGVGVTRVNSIEKLDSSGRSIGRVTGFQVRGKTLLFDNPPSTGDTFRVWIEKMFTDIAEVPEIWDTHILNLMKLQAYETLEADRSRYYKYSSVAKPEGGNLGNFNNIITRLETQIKLREQQLRRVRRAASLKLV